MKIKRKDSFFGLHFDFHASEYTENIGENTTEEMIKEFHEKGLEVALWTVNDKVSLDYCLTLDVDYIESDVFGGNE